MLQADVQSDSGAQDPTDSPPVPTPVGNFDADAQRAWERSQRDRGVWRYRRSTQREKADGTLATRALNELEPGQRITQALLVPLADRIRVAQDEALTAMESPNLKKVPDDTWVLLALKAEVLAVVTIQAALSRCEPGLLAGCAKDLGMKIMHEVELLNWGAAEKRAAKEREETGAEFQHNLHALMYKRNDKVDERVFKKWSKKAPAFTKGDWTPQTRVRIGTALLSMLVEIDGWFEVVTKREGARTKLVFQLTDLGRAWVSSRHNQNEMARPFLLPMICEPRDFEYLPPRVEEDLEPEESFDAA